MEKDMEKIVVIQLDRVRDRLLERSVQLSWDADVLAYLAHEGYDPLYGARPLKRLIQQKVVNMLSTALLKGEIQNETAVTLAMHADQEQGVTFILDHSKTP
jgi:ATP-dependent Clp protease ATP-binding subunit ClpB